MLPQDPYILLSLVNTKLRDQCPDLDSLCDALDAEQGALVGALAEVGFTYDPVANQFKPD